MLSIAYPAGPEPTGNARAFRAFLLAQADELMPKTTGGASKKKHV
jgi:hypothetical protein